MAVFINILNHNLVSVIQTYGTFPCVQGRIQDSFTTSTGRDICTFAVLFSVTRPFCCFTRVCEGHFLLCYKEEFYIAVEPLDRAMANVYF